MKKLITLTLCLLIVFVCASCVTGCTGNTRGEKTAVCYLIANTANSEGLNLTGPLVQDTVFEAIRNFGYISIVNVDGNPNVVHGMSYEIDERYKRASKTRLDKDARKKTAELIKGMQNIVADDPEADYLKALQLGVRSILDLEGYSSKTIIVIGTGLSNTGLLNFQNNFFYAEPDSIVSTIKNKEEIPDLNGISVIFQQLGDTAKPQQELTTAQKNKLKAVYEGLVTSGGGSFKLNNTMAIPANEDIDYPKMTPVKLPKESPIVFDATAFETSNNPLKTPVVLTERQVTFIGDKADYVDPENAREVLKPIADYLESNDIKILLCGTTAGDKDTDFTMSLSLDRAKTVKGTLVDFGIDSDRIITVGKGCSDPWHISGVGYKSAAAAENRKVVVMDASTDIALSLLK